MKIIIKEQQLEGLASRFALEKLNGMDFKLKKYNEFSFFPKGEGRKDADHGIEADWVKGEGYSILVGNSLWRSVRDLFGLTDDQTQTAFIKAFIEKGIRKISEVTTIDFAGVEFPVIEEQVSNEILSSMLEDMFKGYEIKFEGDLRNVYVDNKLMAQLSPSSGVVSLDAFNQLKDNLFFSSDKDLREEVSNWVRNEFKSKNNIGKYLCDTLYKNKVQSIIIEGGKKTLEIFIKNNIWDEARIFKNELKLNNGVLSPRISGVNKSKYKIGKDELRIIYPN